MLRLQALGEMYLHSLTHSFTQSNDSCPGAPPKLGPILEPQRTSKPTRLTPPPSPTGSSFPPTLCTRSVTVPPLVFPPPDQGFLLLSAGGPLRPLLGARRPPAVGSLRASRGWTAREGEREAGGGPGEAPPRWLCAAPPPTLASPGPLARPPARPAPTSSRRAAPSTLLRRQACLAPALRRRRPPPAAPRPVPRRDEGGPGCERGGDSGRAVRQGGPGGRRRLREDVAADGLRRRGLSRGECQPLWHGARILPVACPYSGGSQALLALLSGANASMM